MSDKTINFFDLILVQESGLLNLAENRFAAVDEKKGLSFDEIGRGITFFGEKRSATTEKLELFQNRTSL